MANGAGVTIWRWNQDEPFGSNVADEDPDGNSTLYDMPLRFPGQYADKETNITQNWMRDYDGSIGRFMQSDPIGLQGGLNTYAYVEGMPLGFSDASGLSSLAACANPANAAACAAAGLTMTATGAVTSAGLDLGAQLLANGGDWQAVDYCDVGTSALVGGALGGLGGLALKSYQVARASKAPAAYLQALAQISYKSQGTVGVSVQQSASAGLVSQTGKLYPILSAIQAQYMAMPSASMGAAYNIVVSAARASSMGPGQRLSVSATQMVLNQSGVTTTITASGSITIQRGSQILLQLY